MMGVGYTADGWGLEGTPVSVEGLGTTEKIYGGGYKWASNDYNQGIGYTLSGLTAGQNYVIRAVANSGDGVGQPKIFIYDNTNGNDITEFTGTIASTRTDPDVMLFTFELPTVARYASDANYSWVAADTTSITVKLVNASNAGEVHFHQVELLENLVDNPSMVWLGSGAPGWSLYNSLGVIAQSEDCYSTSCIEYNYSGDYLWNGVRGSGGNATSSFFAEGFWYNNNYDNPHNYDHVTAYPHYTSAITAIYGDSVLRGQAMRRVTGNNVHARMSGTLSHFVIDDYFVYPLDDVSLSVTPSSLANSTETTGVRVDGADVHSEEIDTDQLLSDKGTIKFTFTPRHSFDIGSSFGVANPVIMHAYEDANNYIKLHKSDSSTLQLVAMIGGTEVGVGWTNPTLNSGTSYPMIISYQ